MKGKKDNPFKHVKSKLKGQTWKKIERPTENYKERKWDEMVDNIEFPPKDA
jgi:hypothetical protein